MKFIYPLILGALLSACAHHRDPMLETEVVPMRPIKVADVREERDGVRAPENVKGYPVGRYIDPNNDKVMHERHTVYRVEQEPDWNLRPSEPYELPLGPSIAVSDPATMNSPYAADLENQLSQQQAYNATMAQENDTMKQMFEDLKASQSAETEALKQENKDLRSQLQETSKVLKELRNQIQSMPQAAAPEPAAPVPAPPPVQEKRGWFPIFGMLAAPYFDSLLSTGYIETSDAFAPGAFSLTSLAPP